MTYKNTKSATAALRHHIRMVLVLITLAATNGIFAQSTLGRTSSSEIHKVSHLWQPQLLQNRSGLHIKRRVFKSRLQRVYGFFFLTGQQVKLA